MKSNHFDIDNNVAINVLHVGNHEHAPDEEFILRQDIINEIRNVIAEDPTDPVKRSYDRTVSRILCQDGNNRAEHVPEFYNIVAQLNRKKRQHVPDIPATVEQVEINNEWAETWDGQRNLLHIDNEWGIAVFATNENIELLLNSCRIYVDATFRTCPHAYQQFFTIHAEANDKKQLVRIAKYSR